MKLAGQSMQNHHILMNSLQQIALGQCTGYPAANRSLNTWVLELAKTAGLRIQEWLEPGIGHQPGFPVQFPGSAIVHVQQCAESPDLRTAFYAGSAIFEQHPLPLLIESCKAAFGLKPESKRWERSSDHAYQRNS